MSALEFIRSYYSLFGGRGVWVAAQARLRKRCTEVAVAVPGVKHPVHIRVRTSDISTFRQVFVTGGYDCDFAKSPRTIVDAGANIGLTSVFYANKYPEAKIVAIEPEQSNYELLKKNASSYPNIVAVQGALWKDRSELNIVDSGLGAWGFQTTAGATPELVSKRRQQKICGLTVDLLMKEYGLDYIDLLKVDIEGSEKEVFDHAETWIERVGVIVIELHDGIRPGCTRAFNNAASGFERVCSRGDTLFLARPECMFGEVLSARRAMHAKEVAARESTLRLPCQIVEAFDS